MKEIISKMKNSLSVLISGQESPFYYSLENYSGRKNTRKLTKLLRSSLLKSISKKDTSETNKNKPVKFKLINTSKLVSKGNTFLFDLTKVSPIRSLKYQLKLYDQKNKFGSDNYDNKKIYTPKKNANLSFFRKKPYSINNIHSTSKNIHKKFYTVLGIDKYSHNKNKINNNNNSCLLFKNCVNTNISKSSCITNISMIKTNSSRPYSSRVASISPKNIFAKDLSKKIEETIKEVKDADLDLKNDINNTNKYDNLNILNPNIHKKNKLKKNKSCIDIKKITKELRLDEDSKTYEKRNLERRYKYLDKKCRQILKQSIGIIENEDRLCGKDYRGKFYDLNNKNIFQKLNKEIKEVGKNILFLKKKYKGDKAILPDNEVEYIHKLIKENIYNNKKDENYYLDESIGQSSIINRFFKSSDKKIEKRLAFLHKQNKAKRNRYLYHY